MEDDHATDWRISLQPDNRQILVNMIMETLKNCIPVSGPEGLVKLNKMAEWYEEKSYTAATSKSDYLRKISLKILKMETIFQTTGMPNTIQSNSAASTQNPLDPASHNMQSQVRNQGKSQIPMCNQSQARQHIISQNVQNTFVNAGIQSLSNFPSPLPCATSLSQTSLSKAVCQSTNTQSGIAQNSVGSSVSQGVPLNIFSNLQYLCQQQLQPLLHQILSSSIDSKAQTRHGADSQEENYQKIQSMKEKYLPCLNDMYQEISIKCQKFDSRPNVSESEARERIKLFKNTLERAMQILNVSKNNIVFVEKIASCEKEMISILSSNRPQKPISAQHQIRKPGGHLLSMQPHQQHQQQQQQLKPDNQMNHQMQPTNMQKSVSSKQSTAVTSTCHGQNAVDQEEEIYKKIQFMKEKYLPGLNDMYQKISIKCEQHDSLPNVLNSERIERVKLTKNMLELAIRILNLSKNSIVPAVKMASYAKVILGIFNSSRPQIPVSAQQQVQQPGGHPLSMQPQQQQQQQQHPDNQMNHQMQLMNMPSSVSSKQSTAVTNTHHASIDSKAQTVQNAVDWQEETYQKIQSMKKKYLPGLNDMYQQISIKCQQHDSLPNARKSEQIEILKVFKNSLERAMQTLNVSKNNIVPSQKEKLDAYEKMVLYMLSKGPQKPVSAQQQILQPGCHPLSMQQHERQQQQQQQQHEQQEEPQ